MEDNTSLEVPLSVHILQDSDAVHHDNASKTEADQSNSFAVWDSRLEQEDCKQTAAEPGLVISADELLLSSRYDIHTMKQPFELRFIFCCERSFVEEIETIAGCPFQSVDFGMLEICVYVLPSVFVVFKLLHKATDTDDDVLTL